jgi:olefin beta-lactone synthetase
MNSFKSIPELIYHNSQEMGSKIAIKIPIEPYAVPVRYKSVTYTELSSQIKNAMKKISILGIPRNANVMLLLPVSIELYVITLSLMSCGISVVFFDRALSLPQIKKVIKVANVNYLIGGNKISRLKWLIAGITRLLGIQLKLLDIAQFIFKPDTNHISESQEHVLSILKEIKEYDSAIITFTSGSTGDPKGVIRTHGIIVNQHFALNKEWPHEPDDIDMTCFPVAVLHNLCCGTQTILPAADLSQPGSVNPNIVISQLTTNHVTRLSAAPTFIRKVSQQILKSNIACHLRQIVIGGAPIYPDLLQVLTTAFPHSENFIAYGSSEAEPIASLTFNETIEADEQGFPAGNIAENACVELIVDYKNSFENLELFQLEKSYGIGEVVVSGQHVVRAYVNADRVSLANKIKDNQDNIWHRTGDLAYRDHQDRYWLVGRIADEIIFRNKTYHPYPIEKEILNIKNIQHAALIMVTSNQCCLFIEADFEDVSQIQSVLRNFNLEDILIKHVKPMPLDSRHNSKINRNSLRNKSG